MDTNVIIEAHRTKCWGAVVNVFKVETVEKCCEEAATGDKRRADYVVINVEAMKKSVLIHPVTLLDPDFPYSLYKTMLLTYTEAA
jgi:hypothetical protein